MFNIEVEPIENCEVNIFGCAVKTCTEAATHFVKIWEPLKPEKLCTLCSVCVKQYIEIDVQ